MGTGLEDPLYRRGAKAQRRLAVCEGSEPAQGGTGHVRALFWKISQPSNPPWCAFGLLLWAWEASDLGLALEALPALGEIDVETN